MRKEESMSASQFKPMEWVESKWFNKSAAMIFLVGLAVAIFGGTACAFPSLRHYHNIPFYAVVAGVIISGAAFATVLWAINYDNKKKDWESNWGALRYFVSFYSEIPFRGSARWLVLQGRINCELGKLAITLGEACRDEEAFRDTIPDAVDRASDLDREAVSLAERVSGAKKEFWQLHEAARYFGFNTKPKYGDYLEEASN